MASLKSRKGFSYGTLGGICLGLLVATTAVAANLNVVATTPDLGALAQEVGGEHIQLTTLARPTEDAHFVDPKPSFIVKLNRADILIAGGAQLEIGWLGGLLEGARNRKILPGATGYIKANEGVQMLEIPIELDRSKGDIHEAGNPHYLVDPDNAKIVARHFAEVFSTLDAPAAADYRANLEKFLGRLEVKLTEWHKTLAPYTGRQFVAYHNSWPYFARRFELECKLFLEPKPGLPPTPAHVAEVISRMKAEAVRVVVVDCYVNKRTADLVAAKTGAKVVEVTQFPGGVKGTEGGYFGLMDYLVGSLARAFAEGERQ